MRIEVLGPIGLRTDEGVPVDVAERHLRLLLASLVAADGEPVSADALIERLWDADLPANPNKVLRAKLSRLRTVLDEAQPGARELLTHTPTGYRLAVTPEAVDAGWFKRALERALRLPVGQQKTETLQAALAMWRGEPYGDAADEIWLAPAVAELIEFRGDGLESLAEALVDQGEPEQALRHANDVVEDHPTRERLVSAVMLALYQLGRQHEALQMFESLRHRLAEDLGVDPSPHVRELHSRILRQDPALASKPSPDAATPVSMGRSNLPAETAPLIGRRRESQQIATLLDESRLVTLTGIGGVGKTRLALHLARERKTDVERGAWFVDLTEMTASAQEQSTSGERVASLTVFVLDLPERDVTMSDVDRVVGALGSQSALLVLDNCEHVASEAAGFVVELLRKAPGVRILATSREPLGLPEEQRFDVDTLDTEPDDTRDVSEAAEFFAARAQASDPDFGLDQSTIPAVTELCRRLDGLPLALELAAARIRGISVQDLLERLCDRLNILRRPGRGVPRRQQTLRGMIDWSWSLLDEAEQIVLRRLAIHPGSMTLAAAEAICSDAPQDDASAVASDQVADILIGLVDRSMVTTVSTPAGLRYGLLESITTFAAEKIDDVGERDIVARRHLDYYLDLAREADRQLRGPQQQGWLVRLEAERTQFRHAFAEAAKSADGASAVGLAVATFWYQWIAGRQGHIHDDLRTAIGIPGPRDNAYAAAVTLEACMRLYTQDGDEARLVAEALRIFSGDDVARARVQWFAGSALLSVGVRAAGEQHIDEAISVLTEAGEDWDVAVAASQRDWFLVGNWRDAPRGLPDGRDPETILRDLGDGYGLAQVLGVEHRAAETRGDHHRAAQAAQRALSISLDFGLWGEASDFLGDTAMAALRSGDTAVAIDYLNQARSLAVDMAYDHGSLVADFVAAMIARYEGDLQGAHAALERWMTDGGLDATQRASTHIERGFLAVQQADLTRAEEALGESHALLPKTSDAPVTASVLELAAAVRVVNGHATAAAELLGSAAAQRERAGVQPSAPALRDIDWVRAHIADNMSEEEAAAIFERGRGLDADLQLQSIFGTP